MPEHLRDTIGALRNAALTTIIVLVASFASVASGSPMEEVEGLPRAAPATAQVVEAAPIPPSEGEDGMRDWVAATWLEQIR